MTKKKTKRGSGLYRKNKEAKTGEVIECPVCHTKFTKRQYSQAFCCTECKDKFWNRHRPDRHRYFEDDDDLGCSMDHEWDEAFGVAEYNV